ncbi:hypothetical protein J7T55_002287 [Diaporthe amygdali]|uniref:uncharacterized protein n=1 Tax=Phomopsis amygdali TaxID=1214568 RepID=UPI0022FE45E3|nr:uncharacterized protein J7T55_002287 [Diaporthe amygdali]KAJ0109095.1 hypothetical protein J7T55_002287 [Diaporthe amygdali]
MKQKHFSTLSSPNISYYQAQLRTHVQLAGFLSARQSRSPYELSLDRGVTLDYNCCCVNFKESPATHVPI